jgi:hypothetical protein
VSFWSRGKSFFGGKNTNVPGKTVQPPSRANPPRPPSKPIDKVDRSIHPTDSRYNDVWESLQSKLDRNLSQRGVTEFNKRQNRLAALFDIIGDPRQSDHIQTDAYEELSDELAEFGFIFGHQFNVSDFDWEGFAANYPMMEK